MIIVELTEDRFGKTMKNFNCIEEKLQEIKEVFEADVVETKSTSYPEDEDTRYSRGRRYYREYDREPREYSRYM